jgi:HSP90 family molecular chaperone
VTYESKFFKFEGYDSRYLLENITPKWLFFGIGSIKIRDFFYLESNKKNIKYTDKIEIKNKISKKMKELLSNFSVKKPFCYDLFWMNHSQKLKFNLIKNKNLIKSFSHLLRFFSTRSNYSIISLKDYVLNMKQDQKEIYYFLVKNNIFSRDSPSFEILSKNGIEVLLLVDTIDEMLIENLEKSQSIWKKKRLFFKKIELIEYYENFYQIDLKKINKKWDSSNCIELFSGELSKKFFGVQASYRLFSSSSNFVFLKKSNISSFKSPWNIKNKKTEKKFFLKNNQKFIFEINVSNNLIRVLNKYLQLKKSKKITKEIGILILEITKIKCAIFLTDENEFSKRIENFLTIFLLIIYSEYLSNIIK